MAQESAIDFGAEDKEEEAQFQKVIEELCKNRPGKFSIICTNFKLVVKNVLVFFFFNFTKLTSFPQKKNNLNSRQK